MIDYSRFDIGEAVAALTDKPSTIRFSESGGYVVVMDDDSDPPTIQQIEAQIEEAAAYVPVPATISDRQFFQQAAIVGLITKTEARAAVKTGEVPAAMQIVLDTMDPDSPERFAADMLLEGATEFRRNHPLVEAFAAAQDPPMSSNQIDNFFRAAAQL